MPLSLILLLVTLSIVLIVVLIHYETLRLLSTYLPKLSIQPRLRILIVIYGTFCAHLLEIALFGVGYYLFGHCLNLGTLHGIKHISFLDYMYFSIITYTSLGFGDIYPIGYIRLLTGIEGLIGLLMIGWTASFTYLMMEKLWLDHRQPRKK
ncbi:MAG: potassium channel family protein [Agitococcus sp.]